MTANFEDSNNVPKTYRTIWNRLLHNEKIPAIPHFIVDGSLISDYRKKANLFNNFFASICTPIKHNNTSHYI